MEIIPTKFLVRGLAFFWKDDARIECVERSEHMLNFKIQAYAKEIPWYLVACYGTLYGCEKRQFWETIQNSLEILGNPWMLLVI